MGKQKYYIDIFYDGIFFNLKHQFMMAIVKLL